jgi:hypothetical protein
MTYYTNNYFFLLYILLNKKRKKKKREMADLAHFQFNNPPNITTGSANPGDNYGWGSWFGIPEKGQEVEPYEGVNESTLILPRAYKGRSAFFGNTFKLFALMGNSFLTQTILPLRFTTELSAKWNQYTFVPYIPDVVPDLGVTRTVKMQSLAQSAQLVRYGIGMQMQHGFMNTDIGRACYVMHLRQINQSILEHLQFEVLRALLNVENTNISLSIQLGGLGAVNNAKAFNNTVERELTSWGITQIRERADEVLDLFIETANTTYNSPLTTYIFDSRISCFLSVLAEDQNAYWRTGIPQNANRNDGLGATYRTKSGAIGYTTRRHLVDGEGFNPMERHAQIGEVFRCCDHNVAAYDSYISDNRTQMYYSESDDSMLKISLQDKLNHCYRFDTVTGRLLTFSNTGGNNNAFNDTDKENDHLHHRINGRIAPLSFFGQMKSHHFTTNDYESLAITVFNQMTRDTNRSMADFNGAINTLDKAIEVMHSVSFDQFSSFVRGTYLKFAKNPDRSNTTGRNSSVNKGVVDREHYVPNIHGSLDLNDATGAGYILPPTHATYGGMKTIQQLVLSGVWGSLGYNVEMGKSIADAITVFDDMAECLQDYFGDSLLLSDRFASDTIHAPSSKHTLFDSFFEIKHPSRDVYIDNIRTPLTMGRTAFWGFLEAAEAAVNVEGYPSPDIPGGVSVASSVNVHKSISVKEINDTFNAMDQIDSDSTGSTISQYGDIINRRAKAEIFANIREVKFLRRFPSETYPDPNDPQNQLGYDNNEANLSNLDYSQRLTNPNPYFVEPVQIPTISSLPMDASWYAGTDKRPRTNLFEDDYDGRGRRPNLNENDYNGRRRRTNAMDLYTGRSAPRSSAELFYTDELTDTFGRNYSELVRLVRKASLLVSLVFAFTPITRQSLSSIIRRNILFPWDFLCVRPHANYTTLTTIKCRPGSETGNSYIGLIEVEASDDTSVHVHNLNINYWAGVIIRSPENVVRVDNSFICNYLGGLGSGFIDLASYRPHLVEFDRDAASFMIFSIPRHERLNSQHISICGRPAWTSRDGESIDISALRNTWSYSSAPYYSLLWNFYNQGFNEQAHTIGGGVTLHSSEIASPNSTCFFSLAVYPDPRTHEFNCVSAANGHWKKWAIFPGAAAARRGQVSFASFSGDPWQNHKSISAF